MSTYYLQINPNTDLPSIDALRPFRAVVVVEESVMPEWQSRTSRWLVNSGCLYMMAWGNNPSSWDDSVDLANLEAFNYEQIPEDRFVITAWFDDEPLSDVFWFSKMNAIHPSVDIENALILHIAKLSRENELLSVYAVA